jgi:subfamily B ATP-binding cassette protein HlyB/CyaB
MESNVRLATDVAADAPANRNSTQEGGSALVALAMLARLYRIDLDPRAAAHELGLAGRQPTDDDLARAATRAGISLRKMSGQPLKLLASVKRPALLRRKDGSYVVISSAFTDGTHLVYDPALPRADARRPRRVSLQRTGDDWCGEILLSSLHAERVPNGGFGLRWFLPSLWRYRRPLQHVLIASFFVQIFALLTPLFFQIVIDKVLLHKSVATLMVVTLGLACLGIFDATLQYLRSYTLAHTANRLDVELGARLFRHLLKLPLSYFESRPAGQTVARMRELETIRNFLTGQGLMSSIDLLFAAVFCAVLFCYSWKLTLIVLGSIPVYVMVAALFRPLVREKVREKFNLGAESQQLLVEAVIGAHTLKAAAVEPLIEREWGEKFAAYARASFSSLTTASLGQNGIQYVSKLTNALLLFWGANQVIDGAMTVGGLVAFNMISAQLFAPILRLSQFWQDYQQILVSVERIADIFDAPPEVQPVAPPRLNRMRGAIRFRDVYFRYDPAGPHVLNGISLDIQPGQVIGIVGPSGSGKSTLTKLIQRLYIPERGTIEIDGIDLARVSPAWLRRQLGVVLQENLLFNRTVRENIALPNPFLDLGSIIAVAKLAGADEFISKLPQEYDYRILERGANLSGGQRQRIAIARALVNDPRVLIFDEATSALDYESERIIQANMKHIVQGRTVIIIAHRLAAVRRCDRIIGMAGGRIVEEGTHATLLSRKGGLYAHLWAIQNDAAET